MKKLRTIICLAISLAFFLNTGILISATEIDNTEIDNVGTDLNEFETEAMNDNQTEPIVYYINETQEESNEVINLNGYDKNLWSSMSDVESFVLDDGVFYQGTYQLNNESWVMYVSFNSVTSTFNMATKSLDNETTCYELTFTPEMAGITNINYDNSFWNKVVNYGFSNLDTAIKTSLNYEEAQVMPMSSDVADLYAQMRSIYGNQYSKTLKSTQTRSNQTIRIYESLTYRNQKTGNFAAKALTTLATICNKIPGSVSSKLVAQVLGITGSAIEYNAQVDYYVIRADYARFATANGSTYVYNVTDKFVERTGISERNTAKRARLVSSAAQTFYTHSSAYFNSYSNQADDAYRMFLQVGQKP